MAMTLHLEDLEIWTHIGVPDEERAQAQKLLVSLNFQINPPETDQISQTIDYAQVALAIADFAKSHSCQLIENLSQKLADFLQHQFAITHLELTIKKFILPNCRWVAVSYKR